MNWTRAKKLAIRASWVLMLLAMTVTGVGFLPGTFEGTYTGTQCMCDSFNFMEVRDGRIVMYSSAHPPAQLLGRYELNQDGSAEVYMPPLSPGESEEHICRFIPKFWFTIYEDSDDGTREWIWRRPTSGRVTQMIKDQEIKVVSMPNDKEILSTYYDSSFRELRTETKAVRKREEAEQAVAPKRSLPPSQKSASPVRGSED